MTDSSEYIYTLPFSPPLIEGRLIRRYNRFLADVELLNGKKVIAHCVNTGRMEGLVVPGARVWLSESDNPKRKLRYTWELIELEGVMIGANTVIPNTIVRHLLQQRLIPGMKNWLEMKPEYRINEKSRADFWLQEKKLQHYIEVKNCHLVYPDKRGYFPDSVSVRASKHLNELIELVHKGHKTTVIFIAQRADTKALRPSDLHDPTFAENARRAKAEGVNFRAFQIRPTIEGLIVVKSIPVDLKPYSLEKISAWKETMNHQSGWITVRKKDNG